MLLPGDGEVGDVKLRGEACVLRGFLCSVPGTAMGEQGEYMQTGKGKGEGQAEGTGVGEGEGEWEGREGEAGGRGV